MKNSKLIASLYHAYTIVTDAFLDNLVSFYQPSTETIFNVCAYLVNSIEIGKVPKGISIVRVLNELAKNARVLGAFQTATNVLYRLQEEYIIPQDLRNEVRLQSMTIQVRGRGFWFYQYMMLLYLVLFSVLIHFLLFVADVSRSHTKITRTLFQFAIDVDQPM